MHLLKRLNEDERIIESEYNGSKFWVESTDVFFEGDLAPAPGGVEKAEKNIEKILEVIEPFCEALRKCINPLGDDKPYSSSAEFGLDFSGEGNLFFAKVYTESSIKVTVNWGKPNVGRAGGAGGAGGAGDTSGGILADNTSTKQDQQPSRHQGRRP
jgi:Trypsin-co-occurring domain 1